MSKPKIPKIKKPGALISVSKERALQNEEKEKLTAELIIARSEAAFQKEEKGKLAVELDIGNKALVLGDEEKSRRAIEFGIANKELAFQDEEKGKRAAELMIANKELAFQNNEKEKRAAELSIANIELAYQNDEKEKRAEELTVANKELAFQNKVKEKRAEELIIANKELAFQNDEKEKRAAELSIANRELAFQNNEKEKRAAELSIANIELAFQNDEKEKRAAELVIANKELAFQNKVKEKRAEELDIANKELAFQNDEKGKRAAELSIANRELAFQNKEKEKRAAELSIANIELAFQNDEKEKRAAELSIANRELAFQNNEKEKRAAELVIANNELAFENDEKEKRAAEKEKRAAELIIANRELAFQNEEKEKRAAELVILSADLKDQQEELKRANDELYEKAQLLKKQKEEVEQINKEVEQARRSLEDKAEQLTLASKYKSEFLANMSHDLRTPLNSLLILAQQLFENHDGNLSKKEVGYAHTIHSCGNDLISLINDILDLSKIESGVISVEIAPVNLSEIVLFAETNFRPVAEIKKLSFKIDIGENLPDKVDTDIQRLFQILRNLLSNAFKFTEKGEVKLSIQFPSLEQRSDAGANAFIVFSIQDTGIGISKEKQSLIFEAFRQAEGSTSRKYGGTGLGLSISKGFAELLGGVILLESYPGKGSVFNLYLPLKYNEANNLLKSPPGQLNSPVAIAGTTIKDPDHVIYMDDKLKISTKDKVVLVVKGKDPQFTRSLIVKAHDLDLKLVVAASYLEIFDCIENFNPIGIILDVDTAELNCWNILKLLKNNTRICHLPVYVISDIDYMNIAYEMGAKSFQVKPLSDPDIDQLFEEVIEFNNCKLKKILLVKDDGNENENFTKLLTNELVSASYVSTVDEALKELKLQEFHCVIMDFMLPAVEILLKFLRDERSATPVIVFSNQKIAETELKILTNGHINILAKTEDFYGRLLHQVLMCIHVNVDTLDDEKIQLIKNTIHVQDILENKKVLIVDDDVRNLFALTAAFEKYKLQVLTADSGSKALQIIEIEVGLDIVLMDIMMPDMDGYETIKNIRGQHKNKDLPIIAVTAKAMVGDRKKCIDAGASDYITKPVRTDQLLSLMQVWLYNRQSPDSGGRLNI